MRSCAAGASRRTARVACTAPNRDGQATAIRRAYESAGYGTGQVDFVEGHGTGTKVGDRVELEGLASAFASLGVEGERICGMTSLKSIIGHTKAAAGVGAFIKAVIAVNRRVLPPTAGCSRPNELFETTARALYPILQGEVAEPSRTLCAGVSAMGFGGINSHVTLESGDAPSNRFKPAIDERALMASSQETEVFVFGADDVAALRERLRNLAAEVETLSQAELTDLAARLAREVGAAPKVRAALLATSPDKLACRLREMEEFLRSSAFATGPDHRRQWRRLVGRRSLGRAPDWLPLSRSRVAAAPDGPDPCGTARLGCARPWPMPTGGSCKPPVSPFLR